ncbi:putative gustatory receptor 85a [Drosophila serrata]|uniref:putative gustatory receptor 85a n=1 Tax=Drosophila serrata TaxID=7274 RepID=UPI000A1D3012|nr:putative gustatory receptor 85a [Drosophila serrata]
MPTLTRLIHLGLGFFCALNGIVAFNVDFRSGQLRWSRGLGIYRIVHNLLVLVLTSFLLLDFWNKFFNEISGSIQMTMNFFTYFLMVYLTVISCADCSFRCQGRIYRTLCKLQRQDELSRRRGYTVSKDKERFLDCLLLLLIAMLTLRVGIHVALNALHSRMGFSPCYCFMSECMIFAMNSLAFIILTEICRCWWRMESGLKKIILDPQPRSVAHRLCQIRKLDEMSQSLIDLTAEVCGIFKFVFLWYLLRNLWSGIVVGYLIIRIFLGHGDSDVAFMYFVLAFVTCIQPLMFSLLMNSVTHTTGSLLEAAKQIVRTSYSHEAQVDRRMEWFSLQLARQHTNITVFGTFRMNRSLAFRSSSVILLHVLYMVQSDYSTMFK